MKNILKNVARFIIALIFAIPQLSFGMDQELHDNKPHVILHVDINKTLIAEETGKGFGPSECIAVLLSAEPKYAHTWGDDLERATYYDWVYKTRLSDSNQDSLKKESLSNQAGFIEEAWKKNHPMFAEIVNEHKSLLYCIKTQNHRIVFTSFSNLIAHLRKEKYSFSVILRTFGKDLNRVAQELVTDDGLDEFIYGSFCEGTLHVGERVFSKPQEIIMEFGSGSHYAIQDQYDWWKTHKLQEKGGKPFPIDKSDRRFLSIFFDDNANDPVKPILNIILIGVETHLSELIKMGRVVAVDTCKAIKDPQYYISAFKNALEKWKHFHAREQTKQDSTCLIF